MHSLRIKKEKLRRSGAKIMAGLVVLLGSLSYVMVAAVLNGSVGFLTAMGVTIMGGVGIAKLMSPELVHISLAWIMALAVLFGVVRGGLRALEQYSNHYIAFKLLATLRDKIFRALRVLCPAKLETKEKGSIISMLTADIETLEIFYAHTISPILIATVVSITIILFVGFVTSWYLALCAFLSYIIIGIVVPIISAKFIKKSGVEYRQDFSSFNAYFMDSIKGIKDIVLHGAEEQREQEVAKRSNILLEHTKKMRNNNALATAITEMVVSLCILSTLIVGISLVHTNLLNIPFMIIGIVTIFSSYGPVLALSALPANLTNTFASGDRVLNLLQEKPLILENHTGKIIHFDNLKIENLTFSYLPEESVLKDINMDVESGKIVGIVGESGSGKSTILKLILRFWQKNQGTIALNGIDVDNIQTESLLKNVTLVSQNPYLFDATIAENLRVAKPDATLEELKNACKMASIHQFIESLPERYNTKVVSMGDNISAGEKQRLGIARAFLRQSPLILLDEPTSNVDAINEGMILESLVKQKANKSIILVSHRESTMSIADTVYKIEAGKIHKIR